MDIFSPRLGGSTAEGMHRYRDAFLDARARTAADRARRPPIADLYKGRHVFITGGSGFIGRMIVEQLLRTCPDIGNIYLVLRAKRGQLPQDRLRGLLDVPLFDKVRAEQPGALSKLVVLPGDITELALGLSPEHQDLLRHVSVVFHVAASVRFDDPFQKAVFTNVRSTQEVVRLARRMPGLKALVHVSTAYTNINRALVEERVYPTHIDWRLAIRLAEEMDAGSLVAIDNLGHKLRGFQPNTYTFTKAMAEKLIDEVSGELPVVIVRPSIVTPSYKDPIPGWIDNLYGMGGYWVAGFVGLLRTAYLDLDKVTKFDSVPADIVVKNIVLASWARALDLSIRPRAEGDSAVTATKSVEVLNATIGDIGVTIPELTWCNKTIMANAAPSEMIRDPKLVVHTNYALYALNYLYHHLLFGLVLDTVARLTGQKPRAVNMYRIMLIGLQATKPFAESFFFEMRNQQHLQGLVHPEDEAAYGLEDFYSVRDSVENFKTWTNSSGRGIIVYAMKKEYGPEHFDKIARLKKIMKLYHGTWAAIAGLLVYCLLPA